MADIQTLDSVNSDDSSSFTRKLRQRWELASVLNFFNVFEPLIGKELKISAVEIEDALINPNDSLAKLHITLLKGIPPVNIKNLSKPDAWVTILCKKFAEWWPWVAEGDVPLTAAKGEEISRYKELDPITRLLMLKALCEIRAEQDDLASYINDTLKQGAQPSQFRKDKIGQDKNGISYWYDGNAVIGHRLYREVNVTLKQKLRGKSCLDVQESKSEWETLATDLDEFRKVSEKLSSCQVGVEAAVHETIETEVIPVLEKMQKKKERDLKRQQREAFNLSDVAGVTRSCRTRRPVKYTFDDYDRTIEEAIKLTRKGTGREVGKNDSKYRKHGKGVGGVAASDGDSQGDAYSDEESPASTSEGKESGQQALENSDGENDKTSKGSDGDDEKDQYGEDTENDEEDDQMSESSNNDEQNDIESEEMIDKNVDLKNTNNSGKSYDSESSDFELENGKPDDINGRERFSQGKKRTSGHILREARNPEAKNHYRQRPVRNTSFVVSDSEGGSSSGEGDPSEVSDTEDEISS